MSGGKETKLRDFVFFRFEFRHSKLSVSGELDFLCVNTMFSLLQSITKRGAELLFTATE